MIQNLVRESIKEYFEPYVDHTLRNPVLFGDFRNALTHNTDQRYYEDLLDFEAVFFLFQEVDFLVFILVNSICEKIQQNMEKNLKILIAD